MKSFYKFLLPSALSLLLNAVSPVFATTLYKERRVSELSESLFTYDLSIKTAIGTLDVEIHSKENNEAYVKRVAQILKEDAPALIEYFGYLPWNKIHFVIDGFVADRVPTRANGAATVHPRPIVLLFTTPPAGMEHLVTRGDWMKTLVLHELIHILHLDQTAGWMKVLRYLLGSNGKLGGIAPFWFTEGVATWGEAKFTNGGRLTRRLFNFEYNNRILKKDFCSSSDCLDNPGKPPYQGARYWFGSHFLNWVENKHPGSMACIIKENSDNALIFLNLAFKSCIKENYQNLFEEYYVETFKNLKKDYEQFRESKIVKDWSFIDLKEKEYLSFSNGFHINTGKLFVGMRDKERNKLLKIYNLEDETEKNIEIEDIIESIIPPVHSGELILQTYRQFPFYNSTIWRRFSTEDEKLTAEIDWDEAKYVYKLKHDRVIGVVFEKNIWSVWQRNYSTKSKPEKIFDLPVMASLYNPEVIEKDGKAFISFRFYDSTQTPVHEYLRVDLDNGKVEVLFQSDDTLEVIGSCGKNKILSTSKNYYRLNIQNGYVSNLNTPLQEIVSFSGDRDYVSVLYKRDPKRIYYKKINCQEWLRKNSGIELKRTPTSRPTANKNYLEDKSSYPELDHYLPHRWGVGYSSGNATSGWTFSTGLSDPGFVHSIDGKYKIYTDNSESGGVVTYQHSNDYFDFAVGYFKQYLNSNIKTLPDAIERTSVGIQKDYYSGMMSIIPSVFYSEGRVIDIVSNRKSKSITAGLTLVMDSVNYNDFFKGASLSSYFTKTDTDKYLNYTGYRFKTQVRFHPTYRLNISVQGSYEILDKSDIASGVAYAGGSDDGGGSSFHEFYGIQANDAFGNEITTAKLEGSFLIAEFYKGPRYFPLYVKSFRGVVGAGFLKSEFIYIKSDKKFLLNKSIGNIYTGVSTDFDIFYVTPITIDLLMAQVINDDIVKDESQLLILLKAGL